MNQSSFGRKRDARNLMLRNLATAVILYESVVTTEAKARAVQPLVERVIRTAQIKEPLTARRLLLAALPDENAVKKIFNELIGRYEGQTSGFTRRLALPPRLGDGAPQVVVQLTKNVHLDTLAAAPTAVTAEPQNSSEVSHG